MLASKGKTLVRYGLAMIILAVALVIFDPKTNTVGFNMAAKTSLIPAVMGLFALICGKMAQRPSRTALLWGIGVVFLNMCMLVMPLTKQIPKLQAGQSHLWYSITLTSLMFVLTFGTLVGVSRSLGFPTGDER